MARNCAGQRLTSRSGGIAWRRARKVDGSSLRGAVDVEEIIGKPKARLERKLADGDASARLEIDTFGVLDRPAGGVQRDVYRVPSLFFRSLIHHSHSDGKPLYHDLVGAASEKTCSGGCNENARSYGASAIF